MANIKRYQVKWNDLARIIIDVDHDLLTENKLHQINNFWSFAEDRLDELNGHVLNAVLALLAEECFRLSFQGCFIPSLLIDAFDSGVEGWPRMDGSEGLKIISCDEPEFLVSDMAVSEWENSDDSY